MLNDEMCRHGKFLFRYRSYVPLILVPLGILQLSTYKAYVGGMHDYDQIWDFACLGLAFIGSAVRFITIGYAQSGTSGRNTADGQVADALNTKGMYSLVRHPLYVGNIIMYAAALLFTKSLWFALAGSLALVLYYERIIATEEQYLRSKFGVALEEWSRKTPCLIPRLRGWVRPTLRFSFRAGVRSEFYSIVAIIAVLYVMDSVEHYFVEGRIRADKEWNILLVFAVASFIVFRYLRKHTSILDAKHERIETA